MIKGEREQDTNTFLTGANVEDKEDQEYNIESMENS